MTLPTITGCRSLRRCAGEWRLTRQRRICGNLVRQELAATPFGLTITILLLPEIRLIGIRVDMPTVKIPLVGVYQTRGPGDPYQNWLLGKDQKLDRKSTRLNSSHSQISYAVFCLKKRNNRCLIRNTGYQHSLSFWVVCNAFHHLHVIKRIW